ncbi:MAG: histidine kinase [Geobacteraceae bacterium GWC2_58_44]|nr:MAG: histidine kinase [Geobacteraceae bacterium GWC2_58_44]HBG04054.1 histidine kinase [Geobacter sp.]
MPESKENSDEGPGLELVSHHDHLCLLYQGEAEILTPVIPFIQRGVALGERCVYLNAGEETLERVLKHALLGQKHDMGALILLPAQETWLKGGSFDPARVLHLLKVLCSGAAGDGFKATRIICDMGWAGHDAKRIELLRGFELALNRFAAQNQATLLCLYRREAFPSERMLELAKIHPHLVLDGRPCGNPLYMPPECDLQATRAGSELDLFLAAVKTAASTAADRDRLRQELEQAYAALARKIYENWQEEDTLRASEKELHEKDEALLEHKRRLQTILQHIPAILMAFDTGDHLAACNHEFERVTGFRVEEVMGKPMLELFHAEGELREEVIAAHPPQGGDYRGREWSLRCKDGSLKSVSWANMSRYVAIPGWTNWITGVDVTPRVHAEHELRSLSDELDERTGELESFGYAVSHDLSGQLSKISGHCAVMQDLYGMALSPQCREMLRSIHDATLEMVGRITALQRFTALAASGLQPEEVDLSAMASEIAAQLSGTGVQRPVTFRIEDGVTATGDRKLLRLAMEQLLENAWNYTLGVQHPVIQFGTAEVGGERSFYVSDNGPRPAGKPGVHLPRRKLDSADRLCCGIGLATVQRIITLHRGRIWAADQAGKGGTLYFTV